MMRVLTLVPGGIGDQLLFFPTLESLKQQYPQSEIDVVVEPQSAAAYRVCQSVKKIFKFDYKENNSLANWGNLLGQIRDREYDAVLSLGTSLSVHFLLWLTGIPVRIAFSGAGDFLLSQPIQMNDDRYTAAMYCDLLKGLGINTACPPIKIVVPKIDLDWAINEQKRLEIKDSGYILIYGGSSELATRKGIDRTYPVESWAAIVKDIQTKLPNLPIVLIKSPDEDAFAVKLQAQVPQLLTTSPTDIGKLAATIAAANLLICTDSVPMLLSAAVGTAMVVLFGSTDPEKLLPPGENQNIKIVKAPEGKSIGAIAPQSVLEKIWS